MSQYPLVDRSKLICPLCNQGRVLDESTRPGTIHAILYRPEESEKANWYLKCPVCKQQIGMSPEK